MVLLFFCLHLNEEIRQVTNSEVKLMTDVREQDCQENATRSTWCNLVSDKVDKVNRLKSDCGRNFWFLVVWVKRRYQG